MYGRVLRYVATRLAALVFVLCLPFFYAIVQFLFVKASDVAWSACIAAFTFAWNVIVSAVSPVLSGKLAAIWLRIFASICAFFAASDKTFVGFQVANVNEFCIAAPISMSIRLVQP